MNGYKEIKLTFVGTQFGDIDTKISDGITFKLLSFRFVAFHIGQLGNPVPLQTTMQGRACHPLMVMLRKPLPGNGCGIVGCNA